MVETNTHMLHMDLSKYVSDLNRVNSWEALLMGKYLGIVGFWWRVSVVFFTWLFLR